MLYADVMGVCLDGLVQRLCLWGYTRSSPNIRTKGIRRSLYIYSYVQYDLKFYEFN